MSLSVSLYNAISGLMVNQRGLDITSQNVANVNTDGYSRKITHQESIVLDGTGSGVSISGITRNVDQFLLKDIHATLSQTSETRVMDHYYGRTQDLFGAPGSDSSIGHMVSDLEKALMELSATPESRSAQTEVIDRARLLAQRFRDIAGDIQTLRLEADRSIEDSVDIVNNELKLVEELNIQIARNKALGREVTELEDRRDLSLKTIAEHMDINFFTRDSGEVVIFTEAGRTLLDRTAKTLSHSGANMLSPEAIWNAAGTGAIDGIMLDGVDITGEFRTGKIAALIEMRDTVLPDLNSQFGELALAIYEEINALHNQGSPIPALATMTGDQQFSTADSVPWTGNFRVAVVDDAGTVVEVQDFDLTTYPTVGALVTAIDGMANLNASLNADGELTLVPTGGNLVAVNEMDSAAPLGDRTVGLGTLFGLNNLFTSSLDNYSSYTTAQQANSTTALSLTGTLTFSGSFGSTAVAYGPGDDLNAIAANITANGALAAAGITATVVDQGSGFRLEIRDAGGDNFFVTDSGPLIDNLNVRAGTQTINSSIELRQDLVADPAKLSRGMLSGAAGLLAGDVGLTSGDRSIAQAMANKFQERLDFDGAGNLGITNGTLADFGAAVVGRNATQAETIGDALNSQEFLLQNLENKAASISGVNLDQEMANIILLENAYAASARVITTTQRMMELLEELVR